MTKAGTWTVFARCTLGDVYAADGTSKTAHEVDSASDTFEWVDPCLTASLNNHEVEGVGTAN